MTMNVKIDLGYEFDVKANASDVFAVLSDVPTSASSSPKSIIGRFGQQHLPLGDGENRRCFADFGFGV